MDVQNILPIIWSIGSTISFVLMQVFIKILAESISTQYIICIRSVLLLIFNSFFVFASKEYEPYGQITKEGHENIKYFRLNIKNRKCKGQSYQDFELMMKRLFWNAVSINCFLSCLRYVHISIANALLNTTPVLTFFVEAAYYKKSINRVNLIISVVCFIGIVVILNPSSQISSMSSFNWYLILPLTAAFSNCLNWIYLHQMRNQFKEIVVLEYTYVTHLITSSLIMFIFGTMDNGNENTDFGVFLNLQFYLCVFFMVMFAYLTHFLRIKATFKRKPSQILAFNYIGMIFSVIVDVLYYKSDLKWLTIIGVLLSSIGLLSKLFIDLSTKNPKYQPAV